MGPTVCRMLLDTACFLPLSSSSETTPAFAFWLLPLKCFLDLLPRLLLRLMLLLPRLLLRQLCKYYAASLADSEDERSASWLAGSHGATT